MKYVKGWEEEEDNYALFASPAKKKGQEKTVQRTMWPLWRDWTQGSELSRQEKQEKRGL